MQWQISGDEELDPAGFLSGVRLEAYLGKLDPARGVSREKLEPARGVSWFLILFHNATVLCFYAHMRI
jgi:hypothetical protein